MLECLTFKTHMWLNDKSDACLLDALSQLMELLHLQRHAKVRHWYWITIHCKAAQGCFQMQCMPGNLSSQIHTAATFLYALMAALWEGCIFIATQQQGLHPGNVLHAVLQ